MGGVRVDEQGVHLLRPQFLSSVIRGSPAVRRSDRFSIDSVVRQNPPRFTVTSRQEWGSQLSPFAEVLIQALNVLKTQERLPLGPGLKSEKLSGSQRYPERHTLTLLGIGWHSRYKYTDPLGI